MYENDTRKFNIKILKMSDLYENRMKTKGKVAEQQPFLFIGINFVKRGLPRLLHWLAGVAHLHMEGEKDWRFS